MGAAPVLITDRIFGRDRRFQDAFLPADDHIRRLRDGKRGLAVCLAGTWIHVLGMDGQYVGEALRPDYFDRLEGWRLVARDHGPLGYVDEPAWPKSDGDVLILERIEKEIILLFWRGDGLRSQQVYRFVEP